MNELQTNGSDRVKEALLDETLLQAILVALDGGTE
jgi:hypothetical protein